MTSEGMYSIVIGGSWNKVLVLYYCKNKRREREVDGEPPFESSNPLRVWHLIHTVRRYCRGVAIICHGIKTLSKIKPPPLEGRKVEVYEE